MFYLKIVNQIICHCHSWLARQYVCVVTETESHQMCPSYSDLPDIVMIVVSIPLSIYTAVSVILFYLFDC